MIFTRYDTMNKIRSNTELVREKALEEGFSYVAISKAEKLVDEQSRLQNWLFRGFNAEMAYMNDHFEKRLDPLKLVPRTVSVVSLMYNYHTDKELNPESYKISTYAYGRDYHKVIRKKLKKMLRELKIVIPGLEGRVFVDSAPVLERAWAVKGGLGWIGKNTLLIHPRAGSYFFLAEIMLNVELEYDKEMVSDHCGKCRRCIEACPTQAILPDGYELDAGKCISYLTIEKKGELPEEFRDKMSDYIFGCDICQRVCPWNRFSTKHNEASFEPSEELLKMTSTDWNELSEDRYNRLFEGSAAKRAKFSGLKRNIRFIRQ
jgi:epoxyqueuosine reductase